MRILGRFCSSSAPPRPQDSRSPSPMPTARIVHERHELVNGSGYPQGLTGKDILHEARTICVADVVDLCLKLFRKKRFKFD